MNKDEFYSKEVYCDQLFVDFVRTKYRVNDTKLSNNHQFLLLIYSYEWFNYKTNYSKMIFHPYLLKKDYKDIYSINKISNISIFLLNFTLLFGRKNNKIDNASKIQRKFIIKLFSVLSLYGIMMVLKKESINYYISFKYSQYTKLDLDKEKLKNGLIKYQILDSKGNLNSFSDSTIDKFLKEMLIDESRMNMNTFNNLDLSLKFDKKDF